MGLTLGALLQGKGGRKLPCIFATTLIVLFILTPIACSVPSIPVPVDQESETPLTNGPTGQPSEIAINSTPITSGSLAVQGADGNIYITSHESNTVTLTPSVGHGGIGSILSHPSWSVDGWLSYVEAAPNLTGFSVWGYEAASDSSQLIFESSSSSYIYGSWSPLKCGSDERCRQFAFLADDPDGIALHLAAQEASEPPAFTVSVLGIDQPYYYSWSPDGKSMLWHQGVNRIIEYNIGNNQKFLLSSSAGNFQAPSYSPIDSRTAYVVTVNDRNQLVLANRDRERTVARSSGEGLFLSWSPDGTYIASAEGNYPLRNLAVTRADDLSAVLIEPIGNVISFFWSPDSKKIALVVLEEFAVPLPEAGASSLYYVSSPLQNQPPAIFSWYVLDVDSDSLENLAQFYPTPEEFYILRYFDQYAQSHRIWSPDSRHIVFARNPEPNQISIGEIVILDALDPGASPVLVMPGLQAVYSYQP